MKYMETKQGFQGTPMMRIPLLLSLVFLALMVVVNFAMYFSRMSLKPSSVRDYYLGSEAAFTAARSYGSMLEVTHMHLPMMAVVMLILTHLYLFAPISKQAKIAVTVSAFLSALLNEGASWLVRFVHPDFAVLKIFSFLSLQAVLIFLIGGLAYMLLYSRKDAEKAAAEPSEPQSLPEFTVTTQGRKKLSEQAENLLKTQWLRYKEGKAWGGEEKEIPQAVIDELARAGLAERGSSELKLTPLGWEASKMCVRRHRLAERLLEDVLSVEPALIHELGCKLEHGLQETVVDSICTLLGHPQACAHGSPIPSGRCCEKKSTRMRQLVMSLADCEPGEGGVVSFVRSNDERIMNKLSAMGIFPGITLRLIRRKPAFLFSMGESQFAIDEFLAKHIYLRGVSVETPL